MARTVEEWRKSGDYLPDFMRDFHDQKDLFRTLHERVVVEKHGIAKTVNWVTGHCYVIDIFLWWMARHGYTLQRSRQRLPFDDLEAAISASNDQRKRLEFDAISSLLSDDRQRTDSHYSVDLQSRKESAAIHFASDYGSLSGALTDNGDARAELARLLEQALDQSGLALIDKQNA